MLDDRVIIVKLQAGARDFLFSHAQRLAWGPFIVFLMLFSWGMKLVTHLHLVPGLRIGRAITTLCHI
jgi:uncharacterized protein (DUF486 family)